MVFLEDDLHRDIFYSVDLYWAMRVGKYFLDVIYHSLPKLL